MTTLARKFMLAYEADNKATGGKGKPSRKTRRMAERLMQPKSQRRKKPRVR